MDAILKPAVDDLKKLAVEVSNYYTTQFYIMHIACVHHVDVQ